MNLAKYKKKLEELAKLKNEVDQRFELTALVHEAYQDLVQEQYGFNDKNFILVGGMSLEYYTQASYTTRDIDLIVDFDIIFSETMKRLGFDKLGKNWIKEDLKISIETPTGPFAGEYSRKINVKIKNYIKLPIQSKEDIFLDRVRGVTHWGEKDYLDQIQTLLIKNDFKLDFNYVESQLDEQESKIYNDIMDFFKNKNIVSLEANEYDLLYINLDDEDIDIKAYKGNTFIPINNCILVKPNKFSKYGESKAYLSGDYLGHKLEFLKDVEAYYDSDSDTGFYMNDIFKINMEEATLGKLRLLLMGD